MPKIGRGDGPTAGDPWALSAWSATSTSNPGGSLGRAVFALLRGAEIAVKSAERCVNSLLDAEDRS